MDSNAVLAKVGLESFAMVKAAWSEGEPEETAFFSLGDRSELDGENLIMYTKRPEVKCRVVEGLEKHGFANEGTLTHIPRAPYSFK